MSQTAIYLLIAGILLVLFIALTLRGARTKKWKVVSSQPDPETGGVVTEILTRTMSDKFNDPKDMKCFHNEAGNLVLLGTHWIIRMEEVAGKVDDNEDVEVS